MRDLSQRILLVHKLRQGIRPEERIDDRRDTLGIDQIRRREHFVVAHIHAFADGASHTCQPNPELIIQLFANRAHTAVAQMVDIIHIRLHVGQFDQILDDLDNVFFRQHPDITAGSQVQLPVDAETPHLTQIIAFFREEQIRDDFTRSRIISRLGIT